MRLLDGRRAGAHGRQPVARALELRVAAAPERATDGEVLVGPEAAARERHAECLELLAQPPGTDREDGAPAREDVERGDLLRRDDGVPIREDVCADAEAHAARVACEERQRDGRLEEPFDDGHVAGPGVGPAVVGIDRARVARRDQVIAHPDGIHPQRLGLTREPRQKIGCRERTVVGQRDPDAHGPELAEGAPGTPAGHDQITRTSPDSAMSASRVRSGNDRRRAAAQTSASNGSSLGRASLARSTSSAMRSRAR